MIKSKTVQYRKQRNFEQDILELERIEIAFIWKRTYNINGTFQIINGILREGMRNALEEVNCMFSLIIHNFCNRNILIESFYKCNIYQ